MNNYLNIIDCTGQNPVTTAKTNEVIRIRDEASLKTAQACGILTNLATALDSVKQSAAPQSKGPSFALVDQRPNIINLSIPNSLS